jgi:hypothetical protein
VVRHEGHVGSKPVGEGHHFSHDLHCSIGALVGNIGGDIIDIWPGNYPWMDIRHGRSIHVYHDGEQVRGAGATRCQPGGGPLFIGQSPSEQDGAWLAIGRQHRPQQRRRDLDTLADRIEKI